jgi:hypothetical protein
MFVFLYLLLTDEWNYSKPFVLAVAAIEFGLGFAYGAVYL